MAECAQLVGGLLTYAVNLTGIYPGCYAVDVGPDFLFWVCRCAVKWNLYIPFTPRIELEIANGNLYRRWVVLVCRSKGNIVIDELTINRVEKVRAVYVLDQITVNRSNQV